MKKIELKEKDTEKKVVPVMLPEGKFAYGGCCGDCRFGEYDYSKEMVWCGKFSSWEKPSSTCRYWEEK